MNRLSLRNNRLKYKPARKIPIILEESIEYTDSMMENPEGCQHVTGWTRKMLGSQPVVMSKNLPDHCLELPQVAFKVHSISMNTLDIRWI